MSKSLLTDILRAIRRSISRFLSIVIIIALGTGVFVGIKSAAPSMSETADKYFYDNNLMDIRVQSQLGLTNSDIDTISKISGVSGVMGEKFVDALVLVNGKPEIDIDGSQISTRAYGINLKKLQEHYYGIKDNNFINKPTLIEGTYPTKNNQCLVDASELSAPESYKIGNFIKLEEGSRSDLSGLSVKEFEIVGIIRSPQYVSFERGNSLVGSGKIGTFIYIPDSVFTNDYYSEIYVTVAGAETLEPGSEEYYNHVNPVIEKIKASSDKNIETRVNELKKDLPDQIKNAEKEYTDAKNKYESGLKEAEELIKTYQKYVDDPQGAYNDAVKEAAEALGIAENEFNGNSNAYYDAIETYNKNLEAYKNARNLQTEKYKQLTEAKDKYDSAERMLATAQSSLNTAKQFVTTTQSTINSTSEVLTSLEDYQNGKMDNSQLSQILSTLQGINPDLYASIGSLSAVSMATEAIALINPYLEQQKSQLAVYQADVEKSQQELDNYKSQFEQAATVLNNAQLAYNASEAQLNAAYDELESFYNTLEGSKNELSMAQIELMIGKNEVGNDLDMLKSLIANAPSYLKKAQDEYNSIKASGETKLISAKNKIENAKRLYKNLDTADWSVYDRTSTPGYSSFENAIDNINVLSNIFPVIFFLVAALVCLTTMTRMVEEERTQMGTLKALGYSNSSIVSKYIIYAMFACIIGSVLGIIIGVYAFPYAIYKAYSIMFTLPQLIFTMPVAYIISGTLISLVISLGATIIAASKELKVQPATLMRPKAPKPGKRVLLERVTFVWKRLNFISKVTTRNIFRRKSRFIMTVIGIGGCTALILGSLGFYSSINNLMKMQYDDNGISAYDVQFVFAEEQTENSGLMSILKNDNRITDIMLSSMQSVTGGSERTDSVSDVYLFVPKNSAKLSSFIRLNNRTSNTALTLDDTGAIITEKFAKDTDTQIGDQIWIETAEGKTINIPVANITENYTFNYIYLSENLYQYLFQEAVTYNYAIGTIEPSIMSVTKTDDSASTKKASLAAELMTYDGINAVSYVSDIVDTLNEVIGVLSIIVLIFIIAAAVLAYTVLYNISNINISERERELATIKVLGFHDKEVSAYIYRENIILTIMGIALGMVLGIFVHKMLVVYCAVDTVMYVQTLSWYSYIISAILTAVFAVIVNVIMHKKMQKIDMVSSLKSVE